MLSENQVYFCAMGMPGFWLGVWSLQVVCLLVVQLRWSLVAMGAPSGLFEGAERSTCMMNLGIASEWGWGGVCEAK